jgi:hypothetical protein
MHFNPTDDWQDPSGIPDPTAADPIADLLTLPEPAADLPVPPEPAPLTDLNPMGGLTDPASPGFLDAGLPGAALPWEEAVAPALLDPIDAGAFAHLNHQPDGLTFGGWCGCNQCNCASFVGRGDICETCRHSRSSHYY